MTMPHDLDSVLWSDPPAHYFNTLALRPRRQVGSTCVSTAMAMLTGARPAEFQGRLNTQNPATWSDALEPWKMQLAYCPTDIRKLAHYLPELTDLDDLFLLCYYLPDNPRRLLAEPEENNWLCGSHVVILHRSSILDSMHGQACPAVDHECASYHTKRIFRVLPLGHRRRL
jgi:hypothetical protein